MPLVSAAEKKIRMEKKKVYLPGPILNFTTLQAEKQHIIALFSLLILQPCRHLWTKKENGFPAKCEHGHCVRRLVCRSVLASSVSWFYLMIASVMKQDNHERRNWFDWFRGFEGSLSPVWTLATNYTFWGKHTTLDTSKLPSTGLNSLRGKAEAYVVQDNLSTHGWNWNYASSVWNKALWTCILFSNTMSVFSKQEYYEISKNANRQSLSWSMHGGLNTPMGDKRVQLFKALMSILCRKIPYLQKLMVFKQ